MIRTNGLGTLCAKPTTSRALPDEHGGCFEITLTFVMRCMTRGNGNWPQSIPESDLPARRIPRSVVSSPPLLRGAHEPILAVMGTAIGPLNGSGSILRDSFRKCCSNTRFSKIRWEGGGKICLPPVSPDKIKSASRHGKRPKFSP